MSTQLPQASASTNSAIRAVSSVADEECPKTGTESSAMQPGVKFQKEDFSKAANGDRHGKQIPDYRAVYFIANHDASMVKIGKSKSLASRLGDLTRMNGSPIRLLAWVRGYTAVEKFFHRKFAKHRQHGEWFVLADEIKTAIASAIANENLASSLCPRLAKSDEWRPEPWANEKLDLDCDPVGGEADILNRWEREGGRMLADPVDVEYASLGLWSQQYLAGNGAWRLSAGSLFHSSYVGITRVASQLVDIADPRERQLAFIYAASLGRPPKHLYGKYNPCLVGKLERRIDLGQAKHALPIDFHHCSKCARWYDASATSSGEWLARLAHLTVLVEGAHLARIVGGPERH